MSAAKNVSCQNDRTLITCPGGGGIHFEISWPSNLQICFHKVEHPLTGPLFKEDPCAIFSQATGGQTFNLGTEEKSDTWNFCKLNHPKFWLFINYPHCSQVDGISTKLVKTFCSFKKKTENLYPQHWHRLFNYQPQESSTTSWVLVTWNNSRALLPCHRPRWKSHSWSPVVDLTNGDLATVGVIAAASKDAVGEKDHQKDVLHSQEKHLGGAKVKGQMRSRRKGLWFHCIFPRNSALFLNFVCQVATTFLRYFFFNSLSQQFI